MSDLLTKMTSDAFWMKLVPVTVSVSLRVGLLLIGDTVVMSGRMSVLYSYWFSKVLVREFWVIVISYNPTSLAGVLQVIVI